MPDYKKGKIYKIVNNENNKIYFGSTCQPLHKRISEHRKKHNDCMSKNLGVDLKDCQIILVEKIECECKYELLKRERYYIENNECVNKSVPTRTYKEWYEDNKQKIKERKRALWTKNKEHYLKKAKEWRENNKEYMKQYKENNKKIILKKRKEIYELNKNKINEKKRIEKMTCCCGSVIRKADKTKHFKTKKHINFIKSNSSNC